MNVHDEPPAANGDEVVTKVSPWTVAAPLAALDLPLKVLVCADRRFRCHGEDLC
jgi:hypothetical protein